LELPNIPGDHDRAIERVLVAYERFHAWLSKLHAPHFIELNLTLAQLKALYLVAAAGPLSMRELSERLGTVPSTSSELVDGLVALQLLERVDDPEDRRRVLVQATTMAVDRLEDFNELSRTRLIELLERIDRRSDLVTIERAINLLADAAGSYVREESIS
jgi:DNA-binding MarR family transcriptional regulator